MKEIRNEYLRHVFSKRNSSISYIYLPPIHTIVLYSSHTHHTLKSYTFLILLSHAVVLHLSWCTISYTYSIHLFDTLIRYTYLIHLFDTLSWYTKLIHLVDTLSWYVVHTLIHMFHLQHTLTLFSHTSPQLCALLWKPLLVHQILESITFTLPNTPICLKNKKSEKWKKVVRWCLFMLLIFFFIWPLESLLVSTRIN